MSLPLAFGTTLETIPARVPYLSAPSGGAAGRGRSPVAREGLRVGLAWTGNPSHPKNRARSVSLELLEPLFDLEGVHFYSLQIGEAVAELAARKARVTDLAPFTRDMADTAAQMAQMDLILSIDTSIAHLAGALGRPLWVLLATHPTGAGCWTARTAPGIRPRAYSARPARGTGRRSSKSCAANLWNWPRTSRPLRCRSNTACSSAQQDCQVPDRRVAYG